MITPLVVLALLALMVLPIPTPLLDLFFVLNIGISVAVLISAMRIREVLEFVSFPTLLLLTTLLRLSLNVASTRVVLLQGHTGPDAAGKVIESFGEFLIGGNYVVGIIVFIILTIINFAVITKGAGRVAEVSARFTLDSLPGKQMAIDADLNAGLIGEADAKRRRKQVQQEADFYGSMDGASKFVRGDAIAGIVIVIVNVVGGLLVGVMQHSMDISVAAKVYTLLSIGDGLVAQVPALIISTAAGIVVTRVATDRDFQQQIGDQLRDNAIVLWLTGGVLGLLAVIPGMPHFAFLALGAGFAGLAWGISKARAKEAAAKFKEDSKPVETVEWGDVPVVDPLTLELAFRLVPLVDRADGSDLVQRITAIRKRFVGDIGFLVPVVHIRDNLDLPTETYRLLVYGAEVGRGDVYPDLMMAIEPGPGAAALDGLRATDPTYGIAAYWIARSLRERAISLGYTVVEPAVVIATHIDKLLRDHAHELLGRQETQELLEHVKGRFPKLVDDLVPKVIPLGTVQKVLQLLLVENIPVRDVRTVLETIGEHVGRTQDPTGLLLPVRQRLSRTILQQVMGDDAELKVAAIHPDFERIVEDALAGAPVAPDGALEPGLVKFLGEQAVEAANKLESDGLPPVVLASTATRTTIAQILKRVAPQISVLAMSEIPPTTRIKFEMVICQKPA
jgi:flagellar biosynthesis protein FlhA